MPRLDGPFNDTFKVCHTSDDGGKFRLDPAKQDDNQPLLLITPTYERAEQVRCVGLIILMRESLFLLAAS